LTLNVSASAGPGANNGYELFIYYDPSLKNSGMHDTAWNGHDALLSSDNNVASALISSSGFEQISSDFAGTGDNIHQLAGPESWKRYDRAEKWQRCSARKTESG